MNSIVKKLRGRAGLPALNLAAAAGFGVLTLTSQRSIGLTVAAIALVGLGVRVQDTSYSETTGAQILLACAVLVDYSRATAYRGVAPFVVIGLSISTLTINRLLVSLIDRPSIQAVNLPGYVARRATTLSPATLNVAGLGLIAIIGIGSVGHARPWTVAVITLAVLVASATTALQAVRARHRRRNEDQRLRDAVLEFGPRFALHFSTSPNSEHQVAMWYPYLRRIGPPFVIIVRERAALPIVAAMTDVPVLYCEHESHLERVITPSMTACFYTANGVKNGQMVRFRQLRHIQLLHGDSDKVSSYNPFTGIYDRIFVAGQAGIDRYGANDVTIPAQKFDIVGRPQIDGITVSTSHIRDVEAKVVLYATTWAGSYASPNYCSLPIGEKIVRGLLNAGATVILRPHPYARRTGETAAQLVRLEQILAGDSARTGRRHLFGEIASETMSLFDCVNAADALVSDISGVASDWLYSAKPFALTNVRGADRTAFEAEFPLARAAYVVDQDASNLDEVLAELLTTDSLADARLNLRTYYLGDFPTETYADEFVHTARKYVMGNKP